MLCLACLVQNFCVFMCVQLSSKANSKLELLKVHSVEKQVVAGTNYRMKLEVKGETGAPQAWQVVVYGTSVIVSSTAQHKHAA
jgi:hypothetical protein